MEGNRVASENFVSAAMRTDAPISDAVMSRLANPDVVDLLHSAMGLATEAGELLDMLKKHIFAGKPLDIVNAKEELSDSLWYIAKGIDSVRSTMDDILSLNINKLKLRYPEKFQEKLSHERDVSAERDLLERAERVV